MRARLPALLPPFGAALLCVAWRRQPSVCGAGAHGGGPVRGPKRFSVEAEVSLAAALLAILFERRHARDARLTRGHVPVLSAELLLAAAASFAPWPASYALPAPDGPGACGGRRRQFAAL